MPEPEAGPDGRGAVFAATGARYLTLARRAARRLKQVEPDIAVDLFTDTDISDPVFDRIHRLERTSARPKIEALRRSRFARTLYLDADVIVLAPLSDALDPLDRFDIALVAEQRRNDARNRDQLAGLPVPVPFPQLNSGVIAVRASPATSAFLSDWEARVHDGSQKYDQPALRALLYRSELRLHTLPAEYNVMWLRPFANLTEGFCAPRLLHLPGLHQLPIRDPAVPLDPAEILGARQVEGLGKLLAADQTIGHYLLSAADGPLRPRRVRITRRSRIFDLLRKRLS